MDLGAFPFQTCNWESVPTVTYTGETGQAFWQVFQMGTIRIRKVRYSPGYKADHWCQKGHIILCLEGEMDTELLDGRIMKLTEGMTYMVGEADGAHRTSSAGGCLLFIVD